MTRYTTLDAIAERLSGLDGMVARIAADLVERIRSLTITERALLRGTWIDRAAGQMPLGEYASRWIDERPGLAPKTSVLYEGLLRLHIRPKLGGLMVADVTPAEVRKWRKELLDAGRGRPRWRRRTGSSRRC